MEAVDREPLQAEQDAEIVFKICQLRAAVAREAPTIISATDKAAVPTRRKRSVATEATSSGIVKDTDRIGD